MNHLMIAGHLGSDPDVRFTPNGVKVTSFRIAENQRRSGKDETIWWRVTVWGEQFDKLISYLKKGSAVIVHGELSKPEIYNDKEGHPQVSLNITAQTISFSPFGKTDKEGHSGAAKSNYQNSQSQEVDYSYYEESRQGQGQAVGSSIDDDEIPF